MEAIAVSIGYLTLQHVIIFKTKVIRWQRDGGTTLDLPESLEVHPEFGCRARVVLVRGECRL